MRTIDETYKTLALAPSRRIYCRAVFGTKSGGQWTDSRTYRENDYIISASIDIGAKSGGLEIGRAYCAKLTLRLSCGASVSQSDQVKIGVGFLGADGTISKWVQLGVFYVDTVKKSDNIITITAYDKMLRAQKFYNSSLSYPCAMSKILDEICGQMGISTVDGFALPIDPVVLRAPVKGQDSDGNTVLYTRREVLSYIASACAGNFFFNGGGQLDLTDFLAVSENMAAENSISAEISDETFTVSGVAWIDNGISHSRYDEDTTGLMEFENPLPFQSKPPILDFIDGKLTALAYNNATITRQGCGWYEPGDIVTAFRRDGTSAAVLISGINYKIESGGFTEKIYSSALSENQSNYTTGDVTGQTVPQSTASQQSTFPPAPIMYTFKPFTNVDPAAGGGFEFKSKDGTTQLALSENGIQLSRKNAANGYRAYIGADTYLTAYVEDSKRYNSANALLKPDGFDVSGRAVRTSGVGGVDRYHLYASNGILHGDARDDGGNTKAQINIASELVINYGSTYRIYLSEGQLEITGSGENAMSLSLTANGLYANGKKVLTEE